MTTRNNYDQSSTGTNIEVTVFRDADLAQYEFKSNFQSLDENDSYFYIDNGNVEGHEAITFTITGTDEAVRAYYSRMYNSTNNLTPDEMRAEILEDFNVTVYNYDNAIIASHGIKFIPSKRIACITTRGYSQGDYAAIYYCPDDLQACWGNTPDESQLKTEFDHLFWDQPIFARATINGEEYTHDAGDIYEWDANAFAADVAKQSGIDAALIRAITPEDII